VLYDNITTTDHCWPCMRRVSIWCRQKRSKDRSGSRLSATQQAGDDVGLYKSSFT